MRSRMLWKRLNLSINSAPKFFSPRFASEARHLVSSVPSTVPKQKSGRAGLLMKSIMLIAPVSNLGGVASVMTSKAIGLFHPIPARVAPAGNPLPVQNAQDLQQAQDVLHRIQLEMEKWGWKSIKAGLLLGAIPRIAAGAKENKPGVVLGAGLTALSAPFVGNSTGTLVYLTGKGWLYLSLAKKNKYNMAPIVSAAALKDIVKKHSGSNVSPGRAALLKEWVAQTTGMAVTASKDISNAVNNMGVVVKASAHRIQSSFSKQKSSNLSGTPLTLESILRNPKLLDVSFFLMVAGGVPMLVLHDLPHVVEDTCSALSAAGFTGLLSPIYQEGKNQKGAFGKVLRFVVPTAGLGVLGSEVHAGPAVNEASHLLFSTSMSGLDFYFRQKALKNKPQASPSDHLQTNASLNISAISIPLTTVGLAEA